MQDYNRNSARLEGGLLFLATMALLIPSICNELLRPMRAVVSCRRSVLGLAFLLIGSYALGMIFTLKTHREFCSSSHAEEGDAVWPMRLALVTLAVVTVLVALGQRRVRGICSARCRTLRHDAGLRRVHRRGAGWRRGRDDGGIFGRAESGSTSASASRSGAPRRRSTTAPNRRAQKVCCRGTFSSPPSASCAKMRSAAAASSRLS